MAKYRFYIGVGIGILLGILLGWWHGFAGWPVWAALPFLAGVGALVGYRVVSGDRRALVWLLLWVLPGALVGFVTGVISQAAPVGLLHLALEYAIYAAIDRAAGTGHWARRHLDLRIGGGRAGAGTEPAG